MTFSCRKLWILGGVAVALAGCATKRAAPVQRYGLGMARAEYRDYAQAGASICDAEPRWLSDELTTVNGLLSRFLSSTEQAKEPEAVEHERHLELLQEAMGSLEPVMAVHQTNLQALQACPFARMGAFPALGRRGGTLLEQARARLAEGGELLAAQEAHAKWLEGLPQREQTARQTWCAKSPEVGSTDLYYARRYTDGRTEWLFCDGHVVIQDTHSVEPSLMSPEGLTWKERRKVKPPRYLEAARNYPPEEMDRQPPGLGGAGSAAHSTTTGGQ